MGILLSRWRCGCDWWLLREDQLCVRRFRNQMYFGKAHWQLRLIVDAVSHHGPVTAEEFLGTAGDCCACANPTEALASTVEATCTRLASLHPDLIPKVSPNPPGGATPKSRPRSHLAGC